MGGVGTVPTDPTVLLADADVLIDYRESELAILGLVGQHVGRVAVLPSVLDEVEGVTATECAELGIEVVEVETDRRLRGGDRVSRVVQRSSLLRHVSRGGMDVRHQRRCSPAAL